MSDYYDSRYRDWLARASYKPDYRMSMHPGREFRLEFTSPDAWNAKRRGGAKNTIWIADVHGEFLVPPGLSEDEFYPVISDVLLRHCEDHERKEWFKVDGECLDDPHGKKIFELPAGEVARQTWALIGRVPL